MSKILWKIAEVARFTGTTTVAIRYYEQYGIITPEVTDPKTGYRFYNSKNISEIIYILGLRSLGMPMKEIALIFKENKGVHDYLTTLYEKRNYLNSLINKIEGWIYSQDNVKIKELPALYVQKIKMKGTILDEIILEYDTLLQEKLKHQEPLSKTFPPFIEYNGIISDLYRIDCTLFFVYEAPTSLTTIYPASKYIYVNMEGTLRELYGAYFAIQHFAKENGIILEDKSIEFYQTSSLPSIKNSVLAMIYVPILSEK